MKDLPESSNDSSSLPTHAEILSWCSVAGKAGWFPAVHAPANGVAREKMYEVTLELMRLGFIEVVDWVRGKGQGFAITEYGTQKLGGPIERPASASIPRAITGLTTFERGERAREAFANFSPGIVTISIIVLMMLWFIAGVFLSMNSGVTIQYLRSGDSETLLKLGAASGPRLAAGEWWRIATCCFVHIGVVHLLLNGYGLYLAGSFAESLWGWKKYFVIFLLSALAGSAMATAMKPMSILAGASGGIWGVLLSIVAWLIFHSQHLPPEWVRSSVKQIGMTLIVNIAASALPGISWQAHLGGAIAGFLTACLLQQIRPGENWRTRIAIGALILAILVAVLTYRRAVTVGAAWEPIRISELMKRPFYQQLKQSGLAADEAAAKIPFSRIQKLHSDGAMAMASGNQKQLQQISHVAKDLKADAEEASRLFDRFISLASENGIADESYLKTTHLVNLESNYFHHIVAFADRIESETKNWPPQLKTWLELGKAMKELRVEFTIVQSELSRPKQP